MAVPEVTIVELEKVSAPVDDAEDLDVVAGDHVDDSVWPLEEFSNLKFLQASHEPAGPWKAAQALSSSGDAIDHACWALMGDSAAMNAWIAFT
jgi:hypothetical protein